MQSFSKLIHHSLNLIREEKNLRILQNKEIAAIYDKIKKQKQIPLLYCRQNILQIVQIFKATS